jgi:hypothetical protein
VTRSGREVWLCGSASQAEGLELGDRETPHREMRKADLKKLEEEGWRVEELPGGRRRVSKSGQLTSGWHKG